MLSDCSTKNMYALLNKIGMSFVQLFSCNRSGEVCLCSKKTMNEFVRSGSKSVFMARNLNGLIKFIF